MSYNTYIFDLDGTLLDTLTDLAASCNYALHANGMPTHTVDEVRMMVGNGVRKLMQRAIPHGEDNPLFDKVFADFRQHYMVHGKDHTAPYPGINAMLSDLKTECKKVAVVSNKFDAATKELVAYYFGSLVDVALGENEAAGIRKKPSPDMVIEALRQLDSSPAEAVYVGDSDVDVETAKQSALPCISVLWGFRDREFLLAHGATALISSPEELLEI